MALAIFDLDNTLINGDSDHAWGDFLVKQGLVDSSVIKAANDKFLVQYQMGELDIHEYLEFALNFIKNKTPEELAPIHALFMATSIEPMVLPKANELIAQHRAKGDTLLVITATNRFVTEPIVTRLGFEHLIACEPELKNGRYTGFATGTPSFGHGKVERLNRWLKGNNNTLDGAYFYSDSHNDLPLLSLVANPVAVNPDAKLQAVAEKQGWPVMDLREN